MSHVLLQVLNVDVMQGVYEFGKAPYKPHSSARQVVWIWNEIGELVFREAAQVQEPRAGLAERERNRAQLLLSSVDALLDPADPLPFLALHYQQVKSLMLTSL